jgi:hypothetical protein
MFSISLLVVIGVRQDGQKVLLAVKNMGGESTDPNRRERCATQCVIREMRA